MYNYLISSDDIEALNNKIEEIRKSFNQDFDVVRYDLGEDSLYSIIEPLHDRQRIYGIPDVRIPCLILLYNGSRKHKGFNQKWYQIIKH